MLPLTGNIQEGVTYIRRDGSECTFPDFERSRLKRSDDGYWYGPPGVEDQWCIYSSNEPMNKDIIGIKEEETHVDTAWNDSDGQGA